MCLQPKSPVLAHYHDSDLEDSDASDSNKLESFSLDNSSRSNTAALNTANNTLHNSSSNSNSISISIISSATVDRNIGKQAAGRTDLSSGNSGSSAAATVATAIFSSSSDGPDPVTSAEIEAFAQVNRIIIIHYTVYYKLVMRPLLCFSQKSLQRASVGLHTHLSTCSTAFKLCMLLMHATACSSCCTLH
jgi:hypothetical protein